MLFEILAIVCLSKSRTTCCLCCRSRRSMRFLLLADFAELVFNIGFMSTVYFVQDTQMSQIILALVANVPLVLLKIIAYCGFCCKRDQKAKRNYFNTRVAALVFFVLCVIGQTVVSILAINNDRYYDDLVFGYCTFCYRIDEC